LQGSVGKGQGFESPAGAQSGSSAAMHPAVEAMVGQNKSPWVAAEGGPAEIVVEKSVVLEAFHCAQEGSAQARTKEAVPLGWAAAEYFAARGTLANRVVAAH
jgi:hypothetical protein